MTNELFDLNLQAKGTSVPSIASLSLEELEGKDDKEMEECIRGVCAGIYAGALRVLRLTFSLKT
jgi:hypothetical protein